MLVCPKRWIGLDVRSMDSYKDVEGALVIMSKISLNGVRFSIARSGGAVYFYGFWSRRVRLGA